MHGGWSGSNIAGTSTAVAVVDLRAGSTVTNVSSNDVDDCEDWDSGYQYEIIDGVTVYYGGDLCDSEESDEYKTYLYDGNDAHVPDDDSIVDRERRTWREYCASIFRKGLAPFPSDAPVSPPRGGRRDKLFLHEDLTDTMLPEHHMGLRDMAHVPTSVSDEDEDWSDTSVSSHVEMPALAVWGLPLTVCNSQFRNGASDGTLLSEGMTWLCFLSSADVKTGEVGAMSMDLGGQSLDHWRGVIWNPGIMGQRV